MILAQAIPTTTEPATDFIRPHISNLAVLPIEILLVAALLVVLISALMRRRWPVGFMSLFSAIVGLSALLAVFIAWSSTDGGAKAEQTIGAAFAFDGFTVFLMGVISVTVIIAGLVAEPYLRREELELTEYYTLMFLSAAGAMVMAGANDLITMFIGLEVMSISLYILAGYHKKRITSREAALKYFLLGAFASAIFIYGAALIYGATGSTNFTAIESFLGTTVVVNKGVLLAGMGMLLVGLFFKIAVVPFHMWTPDVYDGAPTPSTGFMASVAKVAGFAAILRLFVVVLGTQKLDWHPIVWLVALITVIVGPLMAIRQTQIKRMLAYSSITNAGFILIGVEVGGTDGVSSALFYLLSYSIIVLGSFAVVSLFQSQVSKRHEISSYAGLSQTNPVLAFAFAILLLAQAGVPLTSGFMAKFGVISAAVDGSSYAIAIVAMITSVIAAFAYLRIVVQMYMRDPEGEPLPIPPTVATAIFLATSITLILGIFPQFALDLARHAALT